MKTILFSTLALGATLVGCANLNHANLPRGARLVGGGLMIQYAAPTDGTVVLIESTSGRPLATQSLATGEKFTFGPDHAGCHQLLFSLYATTNTWDPVDPVKIPTNTCFQIYFVPARANRK